MKFGLTPIEEAEGAVLAHGVRIDGVAYKKGDILTHERRLVLGSAGVKCVVAARLEAGDVDENEAALKLANRLAGQHLRCSAPFTGRVNLFAESAGLAIIDPEAIDRVNAIDEAITVATLPRYRAVADGDMVATIKIIPFATEASTLKAALAATPTGAISISPFKPMRIGVVSTTLPGLKASTVAKTFRVLEARLKPTGARIVGHETVPHEVGPLAKALAGLIDGSDTLIAFGASAITDRRDVIPAAVEAIGGRIERFGMPVDPGNLLLLAERSGVPIIGAPGCARSPKENGFDWVLQRVLAGVPIRDSDIRAMGVGGLLMEIVSRPQRARPMTRVGAIVLAAGQSSRFRAAGGADLTKLVAKLDGKPIVRRVVEAALATKARPVVVVTGYARDSVETAVVDLEIGVAFNPKFASGLASSLGVGLCALPGDVAGALVLLGDMPWIEPRLVDALIEAFLTRKDALAAVPLHEGRRGNPVLLGRGLFDAAMRLEGDEGARRLIGAVGAGELVEVEAAMSAVFDVDTPDDLAAAQCFRRS